MSSATFMDVRRRLLEFSQDARSNLDLDDQLFDAIRVHGWPGVRDGLFRILEADEPVLWQHAVAGIWGAVLDKREMDASRAIALVYHRLPPDPSDHDENLAWSISSHLRKTGHLSGYHPLADPEVLHHLELLRS